MRVTRRNTLLGLLLVASVFSMGHYRSSPNYAAGDAPAGAALTGDSATAFFSVGTIEDARINGSLEADEVVTALGTATWGSGSAFGWTFDASAGTDPVVTPGNGTIDFSTAVTGTSFTADDPGDNLRGAEMIDNTTNCPDPVSGSTGLCTIGGRARVRDTGGSSLAIPASSGTTDITMKCGNVSVDPPSIVLTSTGTATATVTGLAANDVCACAPRVDFDDDLSQKGCLGTLNTLNVRLYNPTALSIDALAQTVDYCCFTK